ncbi:hypothetical protein CSIM01_03042 [Colletotrichum simmondsii]|uniref:Uncharacterized protein n=1 Tax=Colletotrichum simmondsii TaxID=703756 RepID=A0A135SL44_9PEZI|nr:hypothetical protein CSIM01_03042 [Colletotrichum simmondsii]
MGSRFRAGEFSSSSPRTVTVLSCYLLDSLKFSSVADKFFTQIVENGRNGFAPGESEGDAAIGSDMGGFALNSDPWVLTPSQSSWSSAFSDYPWRRLSKEAWPCTYSHTSNRHRASMKRNEEACKIEKVAILGSRHENFAALVKTCASDPIHIELLVNKPMLQEDDPSLLANRTKAGDLPETQNKSHIMEAYEQMRHLHTLSGLSSAPFWNPLGREEEMKITGNFQSTQTTHKRPTKATLAGKVRR